MGQLERELLANIPLGRPECFNSLANAGSYLRRTLQNEFER
jgi:hypothetical protein